MQTILASTVALSAALLFGGSIRAHAQSPITAPTDAPTVMGVGRVLFPMAEAAYRSAAEARSGDGRFVPASRWPAGLSDSASFGVDLVIGDWNRSWALDGGPEGTLRFYGDFNANGDLSDDAPIRLDPAGPGHAGEYTTTVADTVAGVTTAYPFLLKLEVALFGKPGSGERTRLVAYRTRQLRRGILDVAGKRVPFGVVGSEGRFDGPNDAAYLDLDGDGELDLRAENDAAAPASKERFPVGGRITLEGTAYLLEVDPYGRALTLRPIAEPGPGSSTPGTGRSVPDVSIESLDGRIFRLLDLRGRVVLLDFWGLWCAPCIAGVPELVAAYEALAPLGLEVISVNVGDEVGAVRQFVGEHGMNWTHIHEEEGGMLQRLFHVRAFPTYIVIGRDGTLVANELNRDESMMDQLSRFVRR